MKESFAPSFEIEQQHPLGKAIIPNEMATLSYIYLCNFKIEFRVFAFHKVCGFTAAS